MARALEQLDAAAREGIEAAFDIIPSESSHTVIVSCLPAWAREGGDAALLARLADPAARERMKREPCPIWRLVLERRWERIVLLRSAAHPDWAGVDFATLGHLRQADPFDVVLDLLRDEGAAGVSQALWTARDFDDADLCACLALHDRGMLREGAFADLVVFDARQVDDRASLAAPVHHPAGFAHVFVNGQAVRRDGKRNEARPGRVLRGG